MNTGYKIIDQPTLTVKTVLPSTDLRKRCLDVVSQVAEAVSLTNSNEKILNVLLSGVTAEQGLGFNRAYIFLFDKKKNRLNGHLAVGPVDKYEADKIWKSLEDENNSLDELFNDNPEHFINYNQSINRIIRKISLSLDSNPMIGEICQNREYAILDGRQIENINTDNILSEMNAAQLVLAPMISNSKLVGLIAADNEINHNSLNEHSCYILQILANQAAVALERSDLYCEIKNKAEELEISHKKLTDSQEQLIKIEKMSAIGELTASIAHELKNPLTIVGGFANLLKKNNNSDNEEYLSIITQEIKRAENVLEHVLEFSKTSQKEKTSFRYTNLIDDVMALLQNRMNLSKLNIENKIGSDHTELFGNYDQLKYALFQIMKLLTSDIIMPAKLSLNLSCNANLIALDLLVEPELGNLAYTKKNLMKTFSGNKLSQRLPILVADEALRFHGGSFELVAHENMPIQLIIQLPKGENYHEA